MIAKNYCVVYFVHAKKDRFPFKPWSMLLTPYQPSVGKYTDNYTLLISGSKAFSYAGERISMMIMSNKMFSREFDDLVPYFNMKKLGRAIIYGTVYALTSGVAHSAQYAMAAIFKACNDGTYNYIDDVKEYGEKAQIMKKLFTDNGFVIVYDKDGDKDLADGFYFTVAYPGMSSDQLLAEFLYYGVSAKNDFDSSDLNRECKNWR